MVTLLITILSVAGYLIIGRGVLALASGLCGEDVVKGQNSDPADVAMSGLLLIVWPALIVFIMGWVIAKVLRV